MKAESAIELLRKQVEYRAAQSKNTEYTERLAEAVNSLIDLKNHYDQLLEDHWALSNRFSRQNDIEQEYKKRIANILRICHVDTRYADIPSDFTDRYALMADRHDDWVCRTDPWGMPVEERNIPEYWNMIDQHWRRYQVSKEVVRLNERIKRWAYNQLEVISDPQILSALRSIIKLADEAIEINNNIATEAQTT